MTYRWSYTEARTRVSDASVRFTTTVVWAFGRDVVPVCHHAGTLKKIYVYMWVPALLVPV
jgi:hypothetical protein